MPSITFEELDEGTKQAMTASGRGKLEWASSRMVVLRKLGSEIMGRGHLSGKRIAMSLHPEAKTGVLALTLARAGAIVRLTTCNPLSTDDEVSLGLKTFNVAPGTLEVRARKHIDRVEYYSALNWALDISPQIVIDDGGDLVRLLHTERRDLLKEVLGGCEETTTGIIRLKAMAAEGRLEFPMMDVNDCAMKHLFDNRYGTGQSTLDGIMTATNL
jgi:adenosylhomocysteinase